MAALHSILHLTAVPVLGVVTAGVVRSAFASGLTAGKALAIVLLEGLLCFLYFGLGLMFHEGAHGHLGRNRRLNEILFNLSCLPLVVVPSLFRFLHRHHHRNPNSPEDWELCPEASGPLPGPARRRALWRLVVLGGIERGRIQQRMISDPRSPLPESVRRKARMELHLMGIVLVGFAGCWMLLFGATSYLLVYGVPAIVGSWLLVWLQLVEHFGMEQGLRPGATRDVLPHGRFQSFLYFLLFNVNYHAVHHADASIPGRSLPSAHDAWIEDRLERGLAVPFTFPSYFAAFRQMVPILFRELRGDSSPGKKLLEPEKAEEAVG